MKRILIIQGHPDSNPQHFLHGLAASYRQGAEAAGHEVREIRVAELPVRLLTCAEDWEQPADKAIQTVQQSLLWAEHIVLLYPLWMGTMPALTKAFLEQLLRPGFAFTYRDNGSWCKGLKGRSARVVVTMGMPGFIYRWFYCAHSLRSLKRNILVFVGIAPVRTLVIGGVGAQSDMRGKRWLHRLEQLGKAAR